MTKEGISSIISKFFNKKTLNTSFGKITHQGHCYAEFFDISEVSLFKLKENDINTKKYSLNSTHLN